MTAREFLKDFYGTENCCVNYKVYEHSNYIESISFDEAEKRLNKDIEEMIDFYNCFENIPDKKAAGKKGAFQIWKKHLVKF